MHLQPLLISRRADADDFGHSYEANESKPCPARLNLGLGSHGPSIPNVVKGSGPKKGFEGIST